MVELLGVSIGYGRRILASGISERFAPGTLNAVIGRNGAGKSTLLKAIVGLERPLGGEIKYKIQDTRYESNECVEERGKKETLARASSVARVKSTHRSRSVALSTVPKACGGSVRPSGVAERQLRLFRSDETKLATYEADELAKIISFVSTGRPRVANLSVWELAALGRTPHTGWNGRLSADDKFIVSQSLTAVGLDAFADTSIDTLSDGELQRAMIARALAQETPVIVLDEPTAFLDFVSRRKVVALLAKLAHEQHKTVIFSSHELDLVREFSDNILQL